MKVGGLIFPFGADIYRLDPSAIAEVDPDGEDGPQPVGGYDEDFQEPRLEVPEGGTVATPIRREMDPIRIPAQIEPDTWDMLRMYAAGASPSSSIVLTMHYDDLRRLGLVDAGTGEAMLRHGDRLGGIYDRQGALVQAVRNPPGLFIDEMKPESFGMSLRRPKRNILVVNLRARQQAAGVEG